MSSGITIHSLSLLSKRTVGVNMCFFFFFSVLRVDCSETIALNGACLVPRLSQDKYHQLRCLFLITFFLFLKIHVVPAQQQGNGVLGEQNLLIDGEGTGVMLGGPAAGCDVGSRPKAKPLIKLITQSI